jgi:hypothetical protein
MWREVEVQTVGDEVRVLGRTYFEGNPSPDLDCAIYRVRDLEAQRDVVARLERLEALQHANEAVIPNPPTAP